MAKKLGTPHPKPINPKITSAAKNSLCFIEHHFLFNPMVGIQAGGHYNRTTCSRKKTIVFG